jgi:hypothetical protein
VTRVEGTEVLVLDPGSASQVKGGHGARYSLYDVVPGGGEAGGGIEAAWSREFDPVSGQIIGTQIDLNC